MNDIRHKLRARLSPSYLIDRAADAVARDETRGFVELSDLGLDEEHRVFYSPSNRLALSRLMNRIEARPGTAFLDYGAGKGRAVITAARRPFGRVIGVELAESLAEEARANVARLQPKFVCPDVRVEVADAAQFDVPDDVRVAYMYCPFTGPVFAAAFDRLLESVDRRPRPLLVVYTVPFEHNYLLSTGRAHPIDSTPSRWPPWRLGSGEATVSYSVRPAGGDFPDAALLIRRPGFHDARWRSFTDPQVKLGERRVEVRPLVEPPAA